MPDDIDIKRLRPSLKSNWGETLAIEVNSLEDLIRSINATVSLGLGYAPLGDLNRRFGVQAKRFGKTLQGILVNMESDLIVVVRRFPALNKTYVFSAEFMEDMADEFEKDPFGLWHNIEKSLRENAKDEK